MSLTAHTAAGCSAGREAEQAPPRFALSSPCCAGSLGDSLCRTPRCVLATASAAEYCRTAVASAVDARSHAGYKYPKREGAATLRRRAEKYQVAKRWLPGRPPCLGLQANAKTLP